MLFGVVMRGKKDFQLDRRDRAWTGGPISQLFQPSEGLHEEIRKLNFESFRERAGAAIARAQSVRPDWHLHRRVRRRYGRAREGASSAPFAADKLLPCGRILRQSDGSRESGEIRETFLLRFAVYPRFQKLKQFFFLFRRQGIKQPLRFHTGCPQRPQISTSMVTRKNAIRLWRERRHNFARA